MLLKFTEVFTMNLQKINKNEISQKIKEEVEDEGLLTIQIIQNHENKTQASIYLGSKYFTVGYEIDYDFDTLAEIKKSANDVLVFVFTDKELQQAWINSYLQGGISEDRFDRRAEFNPYNKINELFCIDRITYYEITGRDSVYADWKKGIIDWYKNQLI